MEEDCKYKKFIEAEGLMDKFLEWEKKNPQDEEESNVAEGEIGEEDMSSMKPKGKDGLAIVIGK